MRDAFRPPEEAVARPGAGAPAAVAPPPASTSTTARLIETMPPAAAPTAKPSGPSSALALRDGPTAGPSASGAPTDAGLTSAELSRRAPGRWPRPAWHAPWRMYRAVADHLGWVRSVAVDPSNEWFATGAADRTIKIWDLATGHLRLTLTGHIEQVTGLAISKRHPYLFSASLDKEVKCWDLEANRVIRNYHGHLSGVYAVALHPALDVLASSGRDATCRLWDVRSRVQVHCLSGHGDTVTSILTQATDPQIITGSADKTVRLWDIRRVPARTSATLTYHKRGVRALAAHASRYEFVAASADAVKKYRLPSGDFLHNTLAHQKAIINTAAVNEDGVLATGGDDGSLWFTDWKSGHAFQQTATVAQPGSLESERGIFASAFDMSGSRLLTCEADKTVKFWKEDENATPETHPLNFEPPREIRRW